MATRYWDVSAVYAQVVAGSELTDTHSHREKIPIEKHANTALWARCVSTKAAIYSSPSGLEFLAQKIGIERLFIVRVAGQDPRNCLRGDSGASKFNVRIPRDLKCVIQIFLGDGGILLRPLGIDIIATRKDVSILS